MHAALIPTDVSLADSILTKTYPIPHLLWPWPTFLPRSPHVCPQCGIQGLDPAARAYVCSFFGRERNGEKGSNIQGVSSPNPLLMKPGGVGLTGITVAREGKGRPCSRHRDHMVLKGQSADSIQAWLLLQPWTDQLVHECMAGQSSQAGTAVFWSLGCPA